MLDALSKEQIYAGLLAQLTSGSVLRQDEPLARRTTLRVGGSADVYVEPDGEESLSRILQFCEKQSVPFMILGRGSNLLIRDGGIRGVVICLAQGGFLRIDAENMHLHCGAGARLKNIALEARRHGMSGFEFMEGIPGGLGGALRMNAGAMGSALFDRVQTLRFMNRSGQAFERGVSEVTVEYRSCPLFQTHIALGATLRGEPGSIDAISERMRAFSEKRWEHQPKEPSAGCTFKNPDNCPAGKLIDRLGLKGTRIGGAMVSPLHGNFIVNDGTATARDVLNLIELIAQKVKGAEGIALETEVEIVGED